VPFYERQPYIQPLYLIVSEVMRGEIRIPRFQRPGTEDTWSPEQRGDLLDSLYRGFPIGTILLWATKGDQINTLDKVGGFKIPGSPNNTHSRLLIDGHQRLSTLVKLLGPGLKEELNRNGIPVEKCENKPEDYESWCFELRPILIEKQEEQVASRERFILLRTGQNPTQTQIPLSIILNRTDLNKWVRDRELSEEEIASADALRDRLREYNIPVAVLVTPNLQEATESFKRINSSGTRMSDFNMVTALAYRQGFDLQEIFEEYRSSFLEPIGWFDVSNTDILRVCAGIANYNHSPTTFKTNRIADWLNENSKLIEEIFESVKKAAVKLGKLCGMLGTAILPYSWQLITLSICLHGKGDTITEEEEDAIRRWIWLTTYGEVFRGANSSIYTRSHKALEKMMQGGSWQQMERDATIKICPPQRFDFRAARSKAIALVMARHQDGDGYDAAHRALVKGVNSMLTLQPKAQSSDWWNRVIITEEHSISKYRDALKEKETEGNRKKEHEKLLDSIGIPEHAQGTITELLNTRREFLLEKEAEFVKNLGLEWDGGEI